LARKAFVSPELGRHQPSGGERGTRQIGEQDIEPAVLIAYHHQAGFRPPRRGVADRLLATQRGRQIAVAEVPGMASSPP
jgi:hypothetical protein